MLAKDEACERVGEGTAEKKSTQLRGMKEEAGITLRSPTLPDTWYCIWYS